MKECPNPKCIKSDLHNSDLGPKRFCIMCDACGMNGPFGRTKELSIEAWDSLPRAPKLCEKPEVGKYYLLIRDRQFPILARVNAAGFVYASGHAGDIVFSAGDASTKFYGPIELPEGV